MVYFPQLLTPALSKPNHSRGKARLLMLALMIIVADAKLIHLEVELKKYSFDTQDARKFSSDHFIYDLYEESKVSLASKDTHSMILISSNPRSPTWENMHASKLLWSTLNVNPSFSSPNNLFIYKNISLSHLPPNSHPTLYQAGRLQNNWEYLTPEFNPQRKFLDTVNYDDENLFYVDPNKTLLLTPTSKNHDNNFSSDLPLHPNRKKYFFDNKKTWKNFSKPFELDNKDCRSIDDHKASPVKAIIEVKEETQDHPLVNEKNLSTQEGITNCLFDILLLIADNHSLGRSLPANYIFPSDFNSSPHTPFCYLPMVIQSFGKTYHNHHLSERNSNRVFQGISNEDALKDNTASFKELFARLCGFTVKSHSFARQSACSNPLFQVLYLWLNTKHFSLFAPTFMEMASLMTLLPSLSRKKQEMWRKYLVFRGVKDVERMLQPVAYQNDTILPLFGAFMKAEAMKGIIPQLFITMPALDNKKDSHFIVAKKEARGTGNSGWCLRQAMRRKVATRVGFVVGGLSGYEKELKMKERKQLNKIQQNFNTFVVPRFKFASAASSLSSCDSLSSLSSYFSASCGNRSPIHTHLKSNSQSQLKIRPQSCPKSLTLSSVAFPSSRITKNIKSKDPCGSFCSHDSTPHSALLDMNSRLKISSPSSPRILSHHKIDPVTDKTFLARTFDALSSPTSSLIRISEFSWRLSNISPPQHCPKEMLYGLYQRVRNAVDGVKSIFETCKPLSTDENYQWNNLLHLMGERIPDDSFIGKYSQIEVGFRFMEHPPLVPSSRYFKVKRSTLWTLFSAHYSFALGLVKAQCDRSEWEVKWGALLDIANSFDQYLSYFYHINFSSTERIRRQKGDLTATAFSFPNWISSETLESLFSAEYGKIALRISVGGEEREKKRKNRLKQKVGEDYFLFLDNMKLLWESIETLRGEVESLLITPMALGGYDYLRFEITKKKKPRKGKHQPVSKIRIHQKLLRKLKNKVESLVHQYFNGRAFASLFSFIHERNSRRDIHITQGKDLPLKTQQLKTKILDSLETHDLDFLHWNQFLSIWYFIKNSNAFNSANPLQIDLEILWEKYEMEDFKILMYLISAKNEFQYPFFNIHEELPHIECSESSLLQMKKIEAVNTLSGVLARWNNFIHNSKESMKELEEAYTPALIKEIVLFQLHNEDLEVVESQTFLINVWAWILRLNSFLLSDTVLPQ